VKKKEKDVLATPKSFGKIETMASLKYGKKKRLTSTNLPKGGGIRKENMLNFLT